MKLEVGQVYITQGQKLPVQILKAHMHADRPAMVYEGRFMGNQAGLFADQKSFWEENGSHICAGWRLEPVPAQDEPKGKPVKIQLSAEQLSDFEITGRTTVTFEVVLTK